MRVILGIIKSDEGTVTWKGKDFGRWGTGFYGYLPEERGLYPKMRVAEHLEFLGRIHGLDKQKARRRLLAGWNVSSSAIWEVSALRSCPKATSRRYR